MDQTVAKILSVVAIETFEKLAFVLGSHNQENVSNCVDGSVVGVLVKFDGAFSGALAMRISADVLPELAANMLGIDESGPVGVDHQHDALREVANVVCGRLMPLVGGKEAEFSLAQPVIIAESDISDALSPDNPVAYVSLDLEEGGCDLALSIDGNMPVELPPEALELTQQDMDWTTI